MRKRTTRIGRPALVVGVCLAGTLALVLVFWYSSSDSGFGDAVFFYGPFALGCVVALCAGGRGTHVGLALGVFAAIGVALAIALGVFFPGAFEEGGSVVILWIAGWEILGLCATAGIWWVIRRIRTRSDPTPRLGAGPS